MIGCDDLSLAVALGGRESLLVCGLDSDEQVVSQARGSLREREIYGDGVTVSKLTHAEPRDKGRQLHYYHHLG
ncbi:MAG: hypothetical protein ACQESR_16700 [Planctomycetota bacterium]